MDRIEIEEYGLTIINDPKYTTNSCDNCINYDYEYYSENYDRPFIVSRHGVICNSSIRKSAVLLASGGVTGIHENCYVLDGRNLVVCVSDNIFSLKVPELSLNWSVKADSSSCFEVFRFHNGYIVHGEQDISFINLNGIKEWTFSGRDIFTTIDGRDTFKIEGDYIIVKDWQGYTYCLNQYGKQIDR